MSLGSRSSLFTPYSLHYLNKKQGNTHQIVRCNMNIYAQYRHSDLISAVPERGWLNAFRTAFGMSLRQLGARLEISPQSVMEMEEREADGSITLRSLRQAANALDLDLVHVLIPREASLDTMIEKRARQVALTIVLRTSKSMELEEQGVSSERIERAVRSKADELVRTMPRYLWD